MFDRALANMHVFYAHDFTQILRLDLPPPIDADNRTMYQDRGWCYFERAISQMKPASWLSISFSAMEEALDVLPSHKTVPKDLSEGVIKMYKKQLLYSNPKLVEQLAQSEEAMQILEQLNELAKQYCNAVKAFAPIAPEMFREELQAKKFTSKKADMKTVGDLYEKVYLHRSHTTVVQHFTLLFPGQLTQFTKAMPDFSKARQIRFYFCQLTKDDLAKLADALSHYPRHMPELDTISFFECLSGNGTQELLDLSDFERLAAALVEHRQMQQMDGLMFKFGRAVSLLHLPFGNLMEHKPVVDFLETKKFFLWEKSTKIVRALTDRALGAIVPRVARDPMVNEVVNEVVNMASPFVDFLGNAFRR